MNSRLVSDIVRSSLYRGQILHPYRLPGGMRGGETVKGGRVFPKSLGALNSSEMPCLMQTECLLHSLATDPTLDVQVAFLQPVLREVGLLRIPTRQEFFGEDSEFSVVPEAVINGVHYETWQEAVERKIALPGAALLGSEQTVFEHAFPFPSAKAFEPIRDASGRAVAVLVRQYETLKGEVELSARPLRDRRYRLTVRIWNESPIDASRRGDPTAVAMRTFMSTHAILHSHDGEFVSLVNPPPGEAADARNCHNIGAFPFLLGDRHLDLQDTVLSAPVDLGDFPEIDLDSCEADESAALERERRPSYGGRLHYGAGYGSSGSSLAEPGLMTGKNAGTDATFAPKPGRQAPQPIHSVSVMGVNVKAGDRVRIWPKEYDGPQDQMLAGRTATVEALERDLSGRVLLALVVDGSAGRFSQKKFRRFYGADEVEPLANGGI